MGFAAAVDSPESRFYWVRIRDPLVILSVTYTHDQMDGGGDALIQPHPLRRFSSVWKEDGNNTNVLMATYSGCYKHQVRMKA